VSLEAIVEPLKCRAAELGGKFYKTGVVGDAWFVFESHEWARLFAMILSARKLSFEVCPNVYTKGYWIIVFYE
jgi:hypothetical protein